MNGFFSILALGSLALLHAAPTTPGTATEPSARNKMDDMIHQVFVLKPFIVSPQAYTATVNSIVIQQALQNLQQTARSYHQEEKNQGSPGEIHTSQMLKQLTEAQIAFRTGNKGYSLQLLQTSLSNCISCHLKTPSISTEFKSVNRNYFFYNDFLEAEFLYLARNYEEALPLYNKAFSEYPKNKVKPEELEQILYRKLILFARVKKDLPGLNQSLDSDLKNSRISQKLVQQIKEIQTALSDPKRTIMPEVKTLTDASLRKFMESYLNRMTETDPAAPPTAAVLERIQVSGLLHEYLAQKPNTKARADLLYWLARTENYPDAFALTSLPEMYLKKCVLDHPKSSIAAKCLSEYQQLTSKAYLGTSRTTPPEDIQRELKSLEDMISGLKK